MSDKTVQSTANVSSGIVLTSEQLAARKKRNFAIALGLLAWVVLIFVVTLAKLQGGVLLRGL